MADSDPFIRIPTLQPIEIELPESVGDLYDLAYNLAWSWRPEARQLFSSVDGASWARYRNPVELLLNVDRHQWETLIANDTFMGLYESVTESLKGYLRGEPETWFARHADGFEGSIAYFSMEYGVHQSLGIYSGGLGVLSGDHCKSASDLGLPFVAVGLLYRHGYFQQTIDADGFQQHSYPEYDFRRLPLRPVLDRRGAALTVTVPLPKREIAAKVWLAQVGRVPLLLLDTDLAENDPADRGITNVLYVRGREMRLLQELILGVGGARALAALDIRPAVWHINEGHSVLLQLERLRALVEDEGISLGEALERNRRSVAFTTHTPVPAGHERFERPLARAYLDVWAPRLGVETDTLLDLGNSDHGEPNQPLNLTAFALRTSTYVNGVSQLNAEVGERMWRHLFPDRPEGERIVDGITNGVHVPTWLGVEMRSLFERAIGVERAGLMEELDWERVGEISAREVWEAHQAQKERLGRFTRSRLRAQYARHGRPPSEIREVEKVLDPAALTIAFARRFATYKRAGLIFSDLHRLRSLLTHPQRPVQIILAGKAHPADRPGQDLIQHIFKLSLEKDLRGRVVFLENYDMRVGRMLVQGVDVWLNTPRRPLEASGTSGMKAAMNGVLNLSILDGWWPEAFDGGNGWAIGGEEVESEERRQDEIDALSLYGKLEDEVVPAFYDRDGDGVPQRWVEMMKRAMVTVGPRFSADRMVRDYFRKAYRPLLERVAVGAASE